MEIINMTEVMGCNDVMQIIGAAGLCLGFAWFAFGLLLWNDDKCGVWVPIFGGCLILCGWAFGAFGEYDSQPTGRYQYTARITNQAIIADLCDRYDNVEFESDSIVTFESDNPALEHQYGSSDAVKHFCSTCENELSDDDKFCSGCGAKVNGE